MGGATGQVRVGVQALSRNQSKTEVPRVRAFGLQDPVPKDRESTTHVPVTLRAHLQYNFSLCIYVNSFCVVYTCTYAYSYTHIAADI